MGAIRRLSKDMSQNVLSEIPPDYPGITLVHVNYKYAILDIICYLGKSERSKLERNVLRRKQ
jgi:hypothetical protein